MSTPHPAIADPKVAGRLHFRAIKCCARKTGCTGKFRATGERLLQLAASKRSPDYPGVDPEAKTAFWQYRGDADKFPHRVVVCSGLRKIPDAGLFADPASGADAVKSEYGAFTRQVIRHEISHARWTERDSAKLCVALLAARVPHRLFNLFEDVRIEAKARTEAIFGWHCWQKIPTECTDPREYIWACKTAEVGPVGKTPRGSLTRRPEWTGAEKTAPGEDSRLVLWNLFVSACEAETSADVVIICAEFLRHFPETRTEPWPSESSDPGDAIPGDPTMRDGETAPTPSPTTPPPVVPPAPSAPSAPVASKSPDEAPTGRHGAGEWAESPACVREWKPERGHDPAIYAPAWARHLNNPNPDLVRRLAGKIGTITRMVSNRPASLAEMGRSVFLPALAGGDPLCWQRPSPRPGRPELVLVVDMSGSMGGFWEIGGHELVLAFRLAALRRQIGLACWLTGGSRAVRLPAHAPTEIWNGLRPDKGVEAFPETLDYARADVEAARLCVCYTDGDLTDGDIDVSSWRARGVDLVGCCVAPADYAASITEKLGHNFGRVVVDGTITGLASRLAVALSRTR